MAVVWVVVVVVLVDGLLLLSVQGEAALFGDVKAADEEGSKFTTAVSVVSSSARLLRLHINDFYPLVSVEAAVGGNLFPFTWRCEAPCMLLSVPAPNQCIAMCPHVPALSTVL